MSDPLALAQCGASAGYVLPRLADCEADQVTRCVLGPHVRVEDGHRGADDTLGLSEHLEEEGASP